LTETRLGGWLEIEAVLWIAYSKIKLADKKIKKIFQAMLLTKKIV
jgi:hypothetical protein